MSDLPLCACVWAGDPGLTREQLAALDGCAAIELRLDRAPLDYPLASVLAAASLPVIATCRPQREGGEWTGSEAERLQLLRQAASAGAAWIDLEWDVDLGDAPDANTIRSRHAFQPVPPAEFDALLDSVRHDGLSKLAVAVRGAEDALALLERAAARDPQPLLMALGSAGVASRILGPGYGVPWVYAAADPQAPSGPGQLDVASLRSLWRGGRARAASAYGVCGRPVAHSRSPALFNAVFAELGVDALYTWLETPNPQALWDRCAQDPRWRGFSVTVPHKQAAAAWVEEHGELSPAAAATGAVNTLTRTPAGWRGDNTDALALRDLLAARCAAGTAARVIGSGGSARAAAWALRELGARVALYSRSEQRGREVAASLGVAWAGGIDALPRAASPEPVVVVHATPVGMVGGPSPDASLLDSASLGPNTLLYELVYTPRETPLVAQALARGAQVIDGVAHFAGQARAQLGLWLPELELETTRWAELVERALKA